MFLEGLSVLAFLIGTTVPNLTSADSSTINCIRNGTLLDWVPFLTGVLQGKKRASFFKTWLPTQFQSMNEWQNQNFIVFGFGSLDCQVFNVDLCLWGLENVVNSNMARQKELVTKT